MNVDIFYVSWIYLPKKAKKLEILFSEYEKEIIKERKRVLERKREREIDRYIQKER